MQIIDAQNDWETLLSYLPPDYEALAVAHKQIKKQWSNIKIASAAMLLRFIFLHVGANLPLRQTVAVMAKAEPWPAINDAQNAASPTSAIRPRDHVCM